MEDQIAKELENIYDKEQNITKFIKEYLLEIILLL